MKRKSRSRTRSRSRSRDRYSSRNKHQKHSHQKKSSYRRSRTRSRSRSPRHRSPKSHHHKRTANRSRSPSPPISLTLGGSLAFGNIKLKKVSDEPIGPLLDPQAYEGKSEEEIQMMKMMGFSTFDTTKGKHVDGACNASAANIQQKRRYRQYMNRKGGFNRPLDPVA